MRNVLKLNDISKVANDSFPSDYNLTQECASPDAIILRSFNMHEYEIPSSVLCVARAGAGVNNIPIPKCSEKGIVVFNTPGANANAVKELVICGLFLASRKIVDGISWTQTLTENVAKTVESGKKHYVGPELYGKKLGVIGLGAIGVLVANSAVGLGMEVMGYDPYISVDAAWKLDRHVKKQTSLDVLFAECDYISLHVPLTDSTKGLIGKETLDKCKRGVAILNFARGELVDNAAIIEATEIGTVSRYVTDFPTEAILGKKNIVTIPHLGASTPEAEDNCAVMAAKQLVDFIENGNVTNSVNLPNCSMPRQGATRLTVMHKNVVNVLNSVTSLISAEKINISNFISQSKGEYGYAIIDIDEKINYSVVEEIASLDNVIKVRAI